MDEELSSRRISVPAMSTTLQHQPIHFYRSLRTDRKGRVITRKPEVAVILELESELTEEKSEEPKLTTQTSSSSLRKEKIADEKATINLSDSDKDLYIRHPYHQHHHHNHSPIISQHQAHVNHGFINSQSNIHRSTSTLTPVVREQYCSCCRTWTRREKCLLLIVTFLLLIIFGLFVAVGILIERQKTDKTPTDSRPFSLIL